MGGLKLNGVGGELTEAWSYHAGSALRCTTASPDGAFIALGTDTGVLLITVLIPEKDGPLTPQLLAHFPGPPTSALAFGPPRGKNEPSELLVAGTTSGSVRILGVEGNFKELKNLSLLMDHVETATEDVAVRHIVSSPEGDLFAALVGRYMFIFNRFGVAVNRVQLDVQDYHSPVWLPCGTLLCAAGSSIYSWSTTASCDPKQPPAVCPMEVLPGRNGAKITACGASELRLAVGYDDGTVKIFFGTPQVGLGCSRVIHQADPVSKISSLVFDMSSERAYLCAFGDAKMSIWDLTQPGPEHPFPPLAVFECKDSISKVALNKHAAMVAAATTAGDLLLFKADDKSGKPALGPCRKAGKKAALDFLDWHPTGLLFTASKDGELYFWKIPNGPIQEAISAEHLSCSMMSLLSISPDGSNGRSYNGNGRSNGNGRLLQIQDRSAEGNRHSTGAGADNEQAVEAKQGASTPVTPQALPARPARADPASGSTVSPAPASDSDQGSLGKTSTASASAHSGECKTPDPATAAAPAPNRHHELTGASAASSSKSSKTPNFGAEAAHGAQPWPRTHHATNPPERPPPTAIAAAAAGMPFLPPWYPPHGVQNSPQLAVMPNAIPSGAQMSQMLPNQWHAYHQQQLMAAQQWQQQQQYMQYYYNQLPSTGMYPAMQMKPPSMMPMPGGLMPGMEMQDMHMEGHQVDMVQRDYQYAKVMTLYVGNLAARVDEPILINTFNSIGPITNVQVIRDKVTGMSRGFAFITFEQPQFAQYAMHQMNGVVLHGAFEGRTLRVAPSNRNLQMGASGWAN